LDGRGERLKEHVKNLSFPRPTGSAQEKRAAEYVASALRGLGLEPRVDTFFAVSDMNWFPISAGLAAFLGGVFGLFSPTAGGLVSAWAPFLLWYALTRADSPLRFLLPRVRSRNVLAVIPPRDGMKRRVVILAHLDTNRGRLAWSAGNAAGIKWGTAGTLAAYALIPVLLLLTLITRSRWPAYGALLPCLYALSTVGFLLFELGNPYSPGAVDNASSVAVALGLAEELARQPLEHTEVWLRFTGAEEVDHRGAKELLRRHPEVSGAYFLVLEGVGAGELTLVTKEGVLFPYRPDPELLKLVGTVARAHPELGIVEAPLTVVCETQTLRRLGRKALTLAGRDPGTGTLPYWHSPDDTPDHISPKKLGATLEFLRLFLGAVDRSS